MKKVIINGKEYRIAYNLRSLFVFEDMAGKPYTGQSARENYMMLYAMLYANNQDGFSLEIDELIDACDADLNIFDTFMEVMNDEAKRCEAFRLNKKKAVTQ